MPAQTGLFRAPDAVDNRYLDRLRDVSFQPVFILGLHRSGTSILYKMLESTGRFNSVTAYHIAFYNQLLRNHIEGREEAAKREFNKVLRQKNHRDRGIDRLKMSADLPLEYAFLLGKNYLFNQLNERNFAVFEEMCKKIQFIEGRSKRLLLKNPWDFSNFLFIKQKLPSAKFVFIHRRPLHVISSSLRALRVLVNQRTVYSEMVSPLAREAVNNPALSALGKMLLSPPVPPGLFLVVEQRARDACYFLRNLRHLSSQDYVNVRYEDLCSATERTMDKILNFLAIEENPEQFNAFINPRGLSLCPEVKRFQGYIQRRFREYRTRFAYWDS